MAVALTGAAGPAAGAGPRDSVVRIEVTSRTPDLARPWSRNSPSRNSGSGVVLEGGRVLTNAHVVQYASQIEVQPSGSSKKYDATVVAAAPGIDLALLELEEAAGADALPPLAFDTSLPKLKQPVSVLGYPLGGNDLSVTEGVVSRIEFASYYYKTSGLRIQVDAALNPGNSGGPAVSGGKLVGLVYSGIREAENIGYLIPVEEIQAFLDDIADGRYDGKPEIARGGRVCVLENRALRELLGLDDETTGVIVTDLLDSPPGGFRKGDVLTAIGPHDVDNQGFVRLDGDLRLRFSYFVPKVAVDGRVPVTVFRDGAIERLRVPFDTGNKLVLQPLAHRYPEYFIWGPVVFSTATSELAVAGKKRIWELFFRTGNPILSRLLDRRGSPDEEIVVIPNRLFPHRITRGYGSVAVAVVESINGEPVRNLRQVVEMLRDSDAEFIEIDLAGFNPTLVFRRTEAEAATEEILTAEGIRHRASESLRAVWRAEPPTPGGVAAAPARADAPEATDEPPSAEPAAAQ